MIVFYSKKISFPSWELWGDIVYLNLVITEVSQ